MSPSPLTAAGTRRTLQSSPSSNDRHLCRLRIVASSRLRRSSALSSVANKVGEMSKYSLNLRHVKQKQQPKRPPLRAPFGFNDDEENDVERKITLQGSKRKTLKDVEEQQKKALEEDPTVFDYDGVYDKITEKVARPLIQDRKGRKVTKKDFLLDFYTILDKNVAYGAQDPRGRKHYNRAEQRTVETCESGSQGNL
ncbi:uncharacterized protein LOC107475052 [Arachis duranensis]|uniref:Uncharacterized protein LOC107475052 n=1 Tax=Arachis duranensis TaxID=130453 RepID=A0A6P5N1K3_ARADU|nr:uncharacterized protein LOC107475052 [Arachis duranensis]